MSEKVIKISEVLRLLRSGYTRDTSSNLYNPEIGSIKEYYGLTNAELKCLFEHSKLKKVRTIAKPSLIIEDDTEEITENEAGTTVENTQEEINTDNAQVEENAPEVNPNTSTEASAILF